MKMTQVYLPRYRQNKEYESPIHEYRVAKGLTHKELSKQAKVSLQYITELANGMMSPFLKNGELCTPAKRLCEFFNVEPSDLFPRYACDINRNFKHEVVPYETYTEKLAKSSEDLAALREMRIEVNKILTDLNKIEREVVIRTFLLNDTLEGIGKNLNMTKERVRQILAKALRRLRHPVRSEKLLQFWNEM